MPSLVCQDENFQKELAKCTTFIARLNPDTAVPRLLQEMSSAMNDCIHNVPVDLSSLQTAPTVASHDLDELGVRFLCGVVVRMCTDYERLRRLVDENNRAGSTAGDQQVKREIMERDDGSEPGSGTRETSAAPAQESSTVAMVRPDGTREGLMSVHPQPVVFPVQQTTPSPNPRDPSPIKPTLHQSSTLPSSSTGEVEGDATEESTSQPVEDSNRRKYDSRSSARNKEKRTSEETEKHEGRKRRYSITQADQTKKRRVESNGSSRTSSDDMERRGQGSSRRGVSEEGRKSGGGMNGTEKRAQQKAADCTRKPTTPTRTHAEVKMPIAPKDLFNDVTGKGRSFYSTRQMVQTYKKEGVKIFYTCSSCEAQFPSFKELMWHEVYTENKMV